MGSLPDAAAGAFHGRHLGQWVPNSSQSAEMWSLRPPSCGACVGSAGLYRFTMFLTDVNTTTTRRSHFSRPPGMSSLQIKDVYSCDGCGAATTEHRRLRGKPPRW